MWYVIQVMSGAEQRTLELCKALIDNSFFWEIFLPEIEVRKRYCGEWHTERKRMFPGYIFVVTDDIESLFLELIKVPKLTKVLGSERTPIPLSEDEVKLLQHVLNQEHVAEMSEGVMVGERLIIQSGPMKGMEGFVKRIDRHKRMAWLEVELFGRLVEVMLGVEVVK